MKYFFIDDEFKITYDGFIEHINGEYVSGNQSYDDILNIVRELTEDKWFDNTLQLINYLKTAPSLKLKIRTSGTTGDPRIITQSFSNVIRYVKKTSTNLIWAFAYNPNHFAGLQVLFQAMFNLNTIVYVFDKDFERVPGVLDANKVTNISCSPTFMRMILPHLYNIPSLRNISFGGERLHQDLVDKVRLIVPNVHIRNIYASSEAGSLLSSHGEGFYIPERYEDTIKLDNGELCIHRSLLGDFEYEDEWYRTGDMVKVLDTGLFIFDSRKSEIINTGGYRVSPAKIENFISQISGVENVIVYGRANSILGTIVVAEIVCVFDPEIIKNIIKNTKQLLSYEKPRIIKFVDEIELTNTGKVKRQ
jgi:acyl-coenzyme A synthetase/AMP-(fatty) acid ligase